MAQWQTLTKLCQHDSRVQERVVELYRRTNFPYKFRSRFATWIEQQNWLVEIVFETCFLGTVLSAGIPGYLGSCHYQNCVFVLCKILNVSYIVILQ